MLVFGSQNYKEVVQLALKAKKPIGERRSQGNFQKEKGSNSFLGNHQRKAEAQTFQKIPLFRD